MNTDVSTHPPAAPAPRSVPERGFVSARPAASWEEGLLAGNGTLGANVLSRPLNERIIFSHERLFLPMGAPVMPRDQSERLVEIRALIERGHYQQATELQFALSGQDQFMYPDFFVPAFDLNICSQAEGEVLDYRRSLDFQTGEAIVYWSDAQGAYQRRLFVSRTDDIAVLAMTGSRPGSLRCQLSLEPREPSQEYNDDSDVATCSDDVFRDHVSDVETAATASSLTYRNTFRKAYPGSLQAIEGYARVIVTGGTVETHAPGTLVVTGADHVLLFLDIQLLDHPKHSKMTSMEAALAGLPTDYDRLIRRHADLHGALFNRMRLDLGGGADHQRTTEELLEDSSDQDVNRALIEKQFDAARYNIISSTGELPPNLQGIWGGTYVPQWASDYTHNGNLPCAISANLAGNLAELMPAYTSYIESLVPGLEVNARHLFGARGIVLPSRSTTHGFNNALAPTFAGGFWVGGAGWAAHFFYDYYLYTGDRAFLADHALPFMEKVALFFEDYLYPGPDGTWVFSPTQSPENTPGNTTSQGSFNATMDVAIAREVLRNTIVASQKLGRNAGTIPRWVRMLEAMPAYQIDEHGVIKEWLTPLLENNDRHRHSSHLYPLFDGIPDEIARSPALRSAFTKSIANKLDRYWTNNPLGFMSFGLVQLGQAAASLGEGELAYRCLTHLVNRYWLSNLASMHNQGSLLNMDISGGMPALIIRMLVSAESGKLKLLPACPMAWPTGTIEGIQCRGQIEVRCLQWGEDGLRVVLHSGKPQTVVLELPRAISECGVRTGDAEITPSDRTHQRNVTLPAAQDVTLRIRCTG